VRGHILVPVIAGLGALGLAIGLIQSPAIPSGPAWAVAMTLLGGIILLVIKEIGKIRSHNLGERLGTRSSDDVRLDREQIRGEINLLAMTARTLETVKVLEDTLKTVHTILERMTATLETAEETRQITAGVLDTIVRNQMTIDERLRHMPTTAEMLKEGERNRHALRGDAGVLTMGGTLPPATTS